MNMDIHFHSLIVKYGIHVLFIIIHIPTLQGEEQSQCPSLTENPICPCYNFKEGKLIVLTTAEHYNTKFFC